MGHYTIPYIMYGWIDEYDELMSYDSLEELCNYVKKKTDIKINNYLSVATDELGHGKCSTPCYGIMCEIDRETGSAKITEEEKQFVKECYEVWSKKSKKIRNIQYMLVICGDPEFDTHIQYYTLDLDSNDS